MSDKLKIQKDISGTAVIDLGVQGSMQFEEISVFAEDAGEDMIIMVVDKNDPSHKIQITMQKAKSTG
jgi:hypothetical protein